MDYNRLAELLFPEKLPTPEELEIRYPERALPEGAKVTRFAPSPTGYVHLGGVYQTMVGERLAHLSGGVFFMRIEDTDSKREVPGAAENLIRTLSLYGINFDEGAALGETGEIVDKGNYGPYKQSKRAELYHVYAKKLVSEGKAYPCFSTEEEQAEHDASDKKAEIKAKEWSPEEVARQRAEARELRNITLEEVEENLKAGNKFVLRILAEGDGEKKIFFNDLIKGKLEIPENDEDFVLLKSDGIPTYHFAHAVDDHLMRTTHVIRGEEWLPSAAKHVQLFKYLGFRLPKYLHTAQIMQLDEMGNKKKLSKRDLGANMNDYRAIGCAPECVAEYLLTVLNSNFEEWRMQNPDKDYKEFPFSINKMSASGCLLDMEKLKDISKNVISKMTADKVYDSVLSWAEEHDGELYSLLAADREYAVRIFSIGRGGKKPRKDIALWNEVKPFIGFFYDSLFAVEEPFPDKDKADIKKALSEFCDKYDSTLDQTEWFESLKDVAESIGYARETKLYKKNPDEYRGHVGDVAAFLRVAVCGRANSPDLYEVMTVLGRERTLARVTAAIETL